MIRKETHTKFGEFLIVLLNNNPKAKQLYERLEFKEVVRLPEFVKDDNGNYHDEIFLYYKK